MVVKLFFFSHFLILSGAFNCNIKSNNADSRIKKEILCDYDKNVSPEFLNGSGFDVKSIITVSEYYVSEYANRIKLASIIHMSWEDWRLKWIPGTYEGNEEIVVDNTDIWIPSINYFSEDMSPVIYPRSKCRIKSDGTIYCHLMSYLFGPCNIDFSDWPHAYGDCSLQLGTSIDKDEGYTFKSMASVLFDIDYKDEKYDLNGGFEENINGTKIIRKFKTDIQYNFEIVKRDFSSLEAILLPTIILCSTNLLALWIHPRNSERIVLCLTCLFLEIFLYKILSDEIYKVPIKKFPNIGIFCRNVAIMTALTIFESLLLNSLLLSSRKVPNIISFITRSLTESSVGILVFLKNYLIEEHSTKPQRNGHGSTHRGNEETFKSIPSWYISTRAIDRIIFYICIFSYIIMWILLIPRMRV